LRTIYLTTGDAVAVAGDNTKSSHPQIGAGIPIDSQGQTVGFELFAEAEPGKWVRATDLPDGVLSEERRRGQLTEGIVVDGRLMSAINVNNVRDKLIAAKVGLEQASTSFKGDAKSFATQFDHPIEKLLERIELLKRWIGLLIASDALDRDELTMRVEALKETVKKLKVDDEKVIDTINPDDVEPGPIDFMFDVIRGMKGRPALTTGALEVLARAERIGELVPDEHAVLLNPQTLAEVRRLLLD
jgi:hypothetical protein